MENLHLTFAEDERQYYAELFSLCDAENTGKVSLYRALELFHTARVSPDALKQILDQCGASQAVHLSPKQFYTALKLIAVVQTGLPLQLEVVNSGMELPLPRFTHPPEAGKMWPPQYRKLEGPPVSSPDLIQLSDTDGLSTPPQQETTSDGEVNSSFPKSYMPESEQPPAGSPSISSTASDSPTPTNSMAQEKTWASAHWQGMMGEEHRQLLGTEEESSDRHSSDEEYDVWSITEEQREFYTNRFLSLQSDLRGVISGPVAKNFFEKSKLPVQELRKIWQLADVTKDGALSLEEFYAAMHLVVLRRHNIDLPDCLPSSLVPHSQRHPEPTSSSQPPPAPPSGEQISERHEDVSPPVSAQTADTASPLQSKEWTKFADSPTSTISSPGPKPVNFDFQKSVLEQDPKILHPVAVRLTPESQGLQQSVVPAIEEEAAIAARMARKVSDPLTYEQLSGEQQQSSPKKAVHGPGLEGEIRPIQRPQPKKPAAPGPGAIPPPPAPTSASSSQQHSEDSISLSSTSSSSGGGISSGGSSHTSSNSGVCPVSSSSGPASLPLGMATTTTMMGTTGVGPLRKEAPPPPPPRPYRTHGRSSSLDLNRIGRTGLVLGAPPAVPPRVSPSATSPKKSVGHRNEGETMSSLPPETSMFADFSHLKEGGGGRAGGELPARRHGAFEVYRKPFQATSGEVPTSAPSAVRDTGATPDKGTSDGEDVADGGVVRPKDHQNLLASIRNLRQHNSVLLQLNQDLNSELAAMWEERLLLEKQLEKQHE